MKQTDLPTAPAELISELDQACAARSDTLLAKHSSALHRDIEMLQLLMQDVSSHEDLLQLLQDFARFIKANIRGGFKI